MDMPENFEVPSGDDLVLRRELREAINQLPMDCRMFCVLVMDGLSPTQAKRVVGWVGGIAKARIAIICEKLGTFCIDQ
jgi:hypothetical protein